MSHKPRELQLVLVGVAAAAIVAIGYAPLAFHELTTGFSDLTSAARSPQGTYTVSLARTLVGLRLAPHPTSAPAATQSSAKRSSAPSSPTHARTKVMTRSTPVSA